MKTVENLNENQRLIDKMVHFTEITKQDCEKIKNALKAQKAKTSREERLLDFISESVEEFNHEYMIATIEASVSNGKIYYKRNENVGIGFSDKEWDRMAKEYCPEMGSRLATMKELCIWYVLRIVNGDWSLDYLMTDSSSAGNYINSPNATGMLEKTGVVKAGNYYDGAGNSIKIVKTEHGFAHVGGAYYHYGFDYPVGFGYYDNNPLTSRENACGVVVLTNYKF